MNMLSNMLSTSISNHSVTVQCHRSARILKDMCYRRLRIPIMHVEDDHASNLKIPRPLLSDVTVALAIRSPDTARGTPHSLSL
jgi:hypothetical protein